MFLFPQLLSFLSLYAYTYVYVNVCVCVTLYVSCVLDYTRLKYLVKDTNNTSKTIVLSLLLALTSKPDLYCG